MILDEETRSNLFSNKEVKMGTEDMAYRSHNVNVLPAMDGFGGGNHGFGGNGFLGLLIALGLIDRNGNRTGNNATQEQVQHLATSTGLNEVAIKTKLDAMQISICEQTSTLKDSIHGASTVNAVGQNAIGEKITNVGYRVESNAKEIEKTILVDGGLTRKNDDDNSSRTLTAQTMGFHNVQKAFCDLEQNISTQAALHDSRMSAEHCEIKGLLKDVKYDLTMQATVNHSASMEKMDRIQTENLLLNKNDQIRAKDEQIGALKEATRLAQFDALKEEIEEGKCEQRRASENDILSRNIVIGNKTAIGDNNSNNRLSALERGIADITIALNSFFSHNKIINNSLAIGGRNNDVGVGN